MIAPRFEQAVYGSFGFWNRGYGRLAHSAGCRPEWLEAFESACRRFGEPPLAARGHIGRFALRLPGAWLFAGVFPQGADDHDRPGALAFHGLFVDPMAYALAGSNPFPILALTRGNWTAADQGAELPTGKACSIAAHARVADDRNDPQVEAAAQALGRGRPVVIRTDRPITELARSIWSRLSWRRRQKLTLADWAFDNALGFDLVALPRLNGATIDSRALVLERTECTCAISSPATVFDGENAWTA